MHPSVPCLVCGRELPVDYPEGGAQSQPYGGTTFASSGHVGSTVFDGATGQWIEVSLCDSCLRDGAERGRVMLATPPSSRPPSYALFDPGPVGVVASAAPVVPGTPAPPATPMAAAPAVGVPAVGVPAGGVPVVGVPVAGAPAAAAQAAPVGAAEPLVVTAPVDSIRDVLVEPNLWAPASGPCPCTHFEDDASGTDLCACGHGREEHEASGECLVGRPA